MNVLTITDILVTLSLNKTNFTVILQSPKRKPVLSVIFSESSFQWRKCSSWSLAVFMLKTFMADLAEPLKRNCNISPPDNSCRKFQLLVCASLRVRVCVSNWLYRLVLQPRQYTTTYVCSLTMIQSRWGMEHASVLRGKHIFKGGYLVFNPPSPTFPCPTHPFFWANVWIQM